MDKNIPGLYREYGKYVNSSRAFPLDLDGLKPVERKILLVSYLVAKDHYMKSARISGEVLGKFHPHSDCYPTSVQLVHQGFLDGQGNFGTSVGVEEVGPAANRYTGIKLSKFTKDIAFELINYVPWEINELEQEEPLYLPTMIPFCLMSREYVQGIGFGYRTIIPCYKLEDLKKRLMYLLGKGPKVTIKPISDCQIISDNKKLEELLTTGKAAIEFKGIMKVEPTYSKIIIKSWPDGKKFQTILDKLSAELDNQDIGFTDLSTTETTIVFEVLKQRNRDEILKKVVKKLEDVLTGSVSFEIIVTDLEKGTRTVSIDELLINTYNMFKETNINMLKTEILRMEDLISEYKFLTKLKPYLAKYLKVKDDFEVLIDCISKDSKIDKDTIKMIFGKYRISKLLSINTDTTQLVEKKESLGKSLKDIDNFVISKY